jgi:hypothetical protein
LLLRDELGRKEDEPAENGGEFHRAPEVIPVMVNAQQNSVKSVVPILRVRSAWVDRADPRSFTLIDRKARLKKLLDRKKSVPCTSITPRARAALKQQADTLWYFDAFDS